jgi:hypothetical protein
MRRKLNAVSLSIIGIAVLIMIIGALTGSHGPNLAFHRGMWAANPREIGPLAGVTR